jgi:hypothetical protein
MTLLSLLHRALLVIHVIVFALTLAAALREDWRLLTTRRIEVRRVAHTARAAAVGLSMLWSSGLMLAALGAAMSPSPWSPSAALQAKLLIVSVLTANGLALQAWVLPRLWGDAPVPRGRPWLAAALGSISSASWLAAAMVSVAKVVWPGWSFAGFMALYGLTIGLCLALAFSALRSWPVDAGHRVAPV